MADSPLARLATSAIPVFALIAVLLLALVLLVDATENSARFGQLYSALLILSALGLVGLGSLCVWNLLRLIRQVKSRQSGARLTGRFVGAFSVLAITPVLIVYFFSLQFLNRGIDSWFDVRTESALSKALELSQAAIDGRMRDRLKQIERMAIELDDMADDAAFARLNDAYELSGASELALITSGGRVIAATSESTAIVPNSPDDAVLLQLRQAGSYIGLDPIGTSGWFIRVIAAIPDSRPVQDPRYLQALFPVATRINELAGAVEAAYAQNQELAYLREPLKLTFILTLSLVLLFSLLSAIWAAFFFGRRMVAPLREMAAMTRSVAAGDYERQLPPGGADELGFLVDSFNAMTRTLSRARDETRQSQQQVEEQRTYLEAVLTRLSSGVLTVDAQGRLFTVNKMAEQILGAELAAGIGQPLEEVSEKNPHLHALLSLLSVRFDKREEDWREELTLSGSSGRQILMCRGTSLPNPDGKDSGHLLVFDDLTTLIEAQRNQAWSEVARRLAHEIKNPLTPIQLSAERLRHKYLAKMAPDDSKTLDRLTRTIVQQVEGMKEMVNAFTDYARGPRVHAQPLDLNGLIGDVAELYTNERSTNTIELALEPGLPIVSGDPNRMRQVFHNLIKNALEAKSNSDERKIRISTAYHHKGAGGLTEVRVEDEGEGIANELVEHLFEPYVSSKPKGTGLGLAIVKKIVEEHGGVVWAENRAEARGARIVIRLPVSDVRALSEPLEPHATRDKATV
ncbi:MAG: HAMP domain-containing protein [Gammaproteobacteria bacterium]|nr:HAMP domain-containing protein [Gammaproteobacteria bacterium]